MGDKSETDTHKEKKRVCEQGREGKERGGQKDREYKKRERERESESERERHTHTYTQGESDTHAQTERKRWRRKKERKIEGDKVIHNLVESLVGVTCSHLN